MSLKIAARGKQAAGGAAPSRFSLAARLTVWYTFAAFSLVLFASIVAYWGLITSLDRVRRSVPARRNSPRAFRAARHAVAQGRYRHGVGSARAAARRAASRWSKAPGMSEALASPAFPPPSRLDDPLARREHPHARRAVVSHVVGTGGGGGFGGGLYRASGRRSNARR